MAILGFPEWVPFRELLELQRELDRVFDSPYGFDLGLSGRGVSPAVNVFTDRDACVLRLEAPGIDPKDLKIETRGQTLHICGRREPNVPDEGSFHRRERRFGEFARSLQLPADYDVEGAEASYRNGMLTLRVPKKEAAKPRQIDVKAA